jgi:hypothetical protein
MKALSEKINIILKEEKRAYKANGRIKGGFGSFNITTRSRECIPEGEVPKIVNDHSDPRSIKSKNADILLRLFTTLSPEDKTKMKEYLLENLSRSKEFYDVGYLIMFVLSRIGETVKALEVARENLKGDADHGFSNLLAMLAQIVSYQYASLDEETYLQIESAMQGENEYDFGLLDKVNIAKLKILEKQLEDVNPEINYDRDEILDLWTQTFNSSEIPDTINEIEELFIKGEFTKTSFATCIDRVRVLLIEVLRKVAKSTSEKINTKKNISELRDHEVIKYLGDNDFIEGILVGLIRSFYGFVSGTGSHVAIAPREYARLTKNMAYELVLLLLTRYKSS